MGWIAGVFYSTDKIEGDPYQSIDFDDWLFTRGFITWKQDTEAAAAFGHLDWLLSERLTLTLGARYSWERKEFRARSVDLNPFGTSCILDLFCNPGFVGPVVLASADDEIEAKDLSGKVGFEYSPSEKWMIYGSLGKGFKSGGFGGGFAFGDEQFEPFEEEEILAYEVGAKTNFAGGKISFNTSVFRYDYRDLQLFAVQTNDLGLPSLVLTNASNAEVRGLEADLWVRGIAGFDLNLGVGLLDTELVDFLSAGADLSGNDLANAPALTLNGLVRYAWTWGEGTASSIGVDWNYSDEVFKEVTNNPIFAADNYWLVGARWAIDWRRFGLAAWGKNLTDEVYITDAFDLSALLQSFRIYGRPRTYGVTLTLRWN